MSDLPPVIEVEGVGKRYRIGGKALSFPTLREQFLAPFRRLGGERAPEPEEFWALREIAFAVERGERLAIIGRNGSGKSTLLKILSRITEPTEGKVTLRGRVASLLEVGTGFHPELTGRENIFMNGAVLGMARAEINRKFDAIVEFAAIGVFLDTPVKRYSSGMFVRLAFAVAAHLEPEILVVDEVLAVGDTEFQKKCLGKMREVAAEESRTVLFVSHNLAAVRSLCTRAILLERGRAIATGPVEEVINRYLGDGNRSALADAKAEGKTFDLLAVRAARPDGSALETFKPAVVEIVYKPHQALLDAGARLMFEDLHGTRLLGVDSEDFVRRQTAAAEEEVTVTFRFDSLPLLPGTFRLRVTLKSSAEPIHWDVPLDLELRVEESSVYGTRRTERWRNGLVAAKAEVTVKTN